MNDRVFLTNDDGIFAPGLKALEKSLAQRKIPFFTSAPFYEKSGASHSITLDQPLKVEKFADNRFGVIGTPTDSVFLALHSFCDFKPFYAISGINRGANLGNDVTYSGTFSAALETFYNGVTSFALSLYLTDFTAFSERSFDLCSEFFFEKVLPEIEKRVGKSKLYQTPHFFNVNFPETILNSRDVPIKWTILGRRLYGCDVIKRTDPRGGDYFWIGGNQYSFADVEGSDCNAIKEGSISVSPILPSFSNHEILNKIND